MEKNSVFWWSSTFTEMHILSEGRGPQRGSFLFHFRDSLFLETNFSFNSRYFGLQLSRFRPVLIYDMHGRRFHQPCSGLLISDVRKLTTDIHGLLNHLGSCQTFMTGTTLKGLHSLWYIVWYSHSQITLDYTWNSKDTRFLSDVIWII